MNQHGQLAMKYLQQNNPVEFASINDPQSFFAQMGEEIATQIAALSAQIAGPDLVGESSLDKIIRLRTAQLQATELVYEEFQVWPLPEQTRAEWEDAEMASMDSLLPFLRLIDQERDGGPEAGITIHDLAETYHLPVEALEALLASDSWVMHLEGQSWLKAWENSVQSRWEAVRRSAQLHDSDL